MCACIRVCGACVCVHACVCVCACVCVHAHVCVHIFVIVIVSSDNLSVQINERCPLVFKYTVDHFLV